MRKLEIKKDPIPDRVENYTRVQNYVNENQDDLHTNKPDLVQSFAIQSQLNRLPVSEPSVFFGDSLRHREKIL